MLINLIAALLCFQLNVHTNCDAIIELSFTLEVDFSIRNSGESLIAPQDFGLAPLDKKQISGGDSVPSSAAIFRAVLDGKGSLAQNDVVCANAAMAITTATDCTPLEGFEKAKGALLSGQASKAFKTLQKLSAA